MAHGKSLIPKETREPVAMCGNKECTRPWEHHLRSDGLLLKKFDNGKHWSPYAPDPADAVRRRGSSLRRPAAGRSSLIHKEKALPALATHLAVGGLSTEDLREAAAKGKTMKGRKNTVRLQTVPDAQLFRPRRAV